MPARPAGAVEPAERRRQQRAWYVYDWAASAFSTTVVTVFLGPYLVEVAEAAAGADGRVHPLGVSLRPGSVYPIAVAVSVLLSVLLMPVVGAVADRTQRKRELLGLFAYIGAFATMGLYFLAGERYLLGAALFIVANVAFGVTLVVYYAFLPEIASPDERDRVSSYGWALGYAGGLLLLLANLGLFLAHDAFGVSAAHAVRISLFSAGVWWGVFTLVPLRFLRGAGTQIPFENGGSAESSGAAENAGAADRGGSAGNGGAAEDGRPVQNPAYRQDRDSVERRGSVVVAGFAQLSETLRELRRYPKTLAFLGAFLLYNEGIQTVISQSSVYGSQELNLGETTLIVAVLMVQLLAFLGALALGRLAGTYGTKRTVLGSLVAWMVALALGYQVPAGEPLPFFALAAVIGFVLGGSQALSRSLYSQMIPAGKEAEYFSLYMISDRGTSWLGPLLFALTYELTGSYRASIVSNVAFFLLGFLVLALVPVRAAVRDAGNPVPARL
jgi:UMF1 family MFS transporter